MDIVEQIKKWRCDLHRIPELGLEEVKTSKYIRDELYKMGYEYETYLTSTFVYIDHQSDKTIAFRSDIDGLPIHEKNDIDFKSTHEGRMHACGHDGHTAALLALAKEIKDRPCKYNILLIFQMAEEAPGGAKLIIQEGILDKYHVQAIFGMHLMPDIEEGTIACKAGPLMAQCGELNVTVHGKSAHAGLYYQGIDALYIAHLLYHQYKDIFITKISPFQPCLLNIGKFEAGTARNSVASTASFYGTMRTYDADLFLEITRMMSKINQQIEESYDCTIDFECDPMYPPVVNDESLFDQFKNITSIQELKEPLMLAEDFSYYQTKIPGIFFFLGTRTEQMNSGLHTETFNFHEEVLLEGLKAYLGIIDHIEI